MKKILLLLAIVMMLSSCRKEHPESQCKVPTKPYEMVNVQNNTSIVLWDAEDFDFNAGNEFYIRYLREFGESNSKTGTACSSWRNGRFHGRNFDWFQSDYGCLIIQMPKGGKVKHASVGVVNGSYEVTREFIKRGYIEKDMDMAIPCMVADGINDAGVAVNINIVIHTPDTDYTTEGDLSSMCVVRYLLDNAGSVDEAISLLSKKTIIQDLVEAAGDESHYMISDKSSTAVVEFKEGEMVVTRFNQGKNGCLSDKGTPAIMTNLYNYSVEEWGIGTDEFFEHNVLALGVERWNKIKNQYSNASNSVEDNFNIAQSVWCCQRMLKDKEPWYTEMVDKFGYGKDEKGWYYKKDGVRITCDGWLSAQKGFWDYYMGDYWKYYEENFGNRPDPHMKENDYWETSHSIIYDLESMKGYLYPFENFYSDDGKPIVICLPE